MTAGIFSGKYLPKKDDTSPAKSRKRKKYNKRNKISAAPTAYTKPLNVLLKQNTRRKIINNTIKASINTRLYSQ